MYTLPKTNLDAVANIRIPQNWSLGAELDPTKYGTAGGCCAEALCFVQTVIDLQLEVELSYEMGAWRRTVLRWKKSKQNLTQESLKISI